MSRPLAINDQNTLSQREIRQREANGKPISPSSSISPTLDPHAINFGTPHTNISPDNASNSDTRSESANKLVVSVNFPRMLPRTPLRVTQDRLAFLDSRLAEASPASLVDSLYQMTAL